MLFSNHPLFSFGDLFNPFRTFLHPFHSFWYACPLLCAVDMTDTLVCSSGYHITLPTPFLFLSALLRVVPIL